MDWQGIRLLSFRIGLVAEYWPWVLDSYTVHGTIVVETSKIKHLIRRMEGPEGQIFYRMMYDVIISFGLTEMTAQFAWMENVCTLLLTSNILYSFYSTTGWHRSIEKSNVMFSFPLNNRDSDVMLFCKGPQPKLCTIRPYWVANRVQIFLCSKLYVHPSLRRC